MSVGQGQMGMRWLWAACVAVFWLCACDDCAPDVVEIGRPELVVEPLAAVFPVPSDGQAVVEVELMLTNISTKTALTIHRVQLTESLRSEVFIVDDADLEGVLLEPEQRLPLRLRWSPHSGKALKGEVVIESNDITGPRIVDVFIPDLDAEMEVQTQPPGQASPGVVELALNGLRVGQSAKATVTLQSVGVAPLSWRNVRLFLDGQLLDEDMERGEEEMALCFDVAETPDDCQAIPAEQTLPRGASSVFALWVTPSMARQRDRIAELEFESNDSDERIFKVRVRLGPVSSTNVCGGVAELHGVPGEVCGTCDQGRWRCASEDALTCVGDPGEAALNGCGGCTELEFEVGAVCGACGSGAWACSENGEAVFCDGNRGDDVRNACGGCLPLEFEPNVACGVCDTGVWSCSEDLEGLTCEGDQGGGILNACGGCEVLAHEPETPCGEGCGHPGSWQCNGLDEVVCEGAEEEPPNACGGCSVLEAVPGAPCGVCDSGTWQCGDEEVLICEGDDGDEALNVCGGCQELLLTLGDTCGVCDDGELVCDGDNDLVCAGDLVASTGEFEFGQLLLLLDDGNNPTSEASRAVDVADFNSDGHLDVFVVGSPGDSGGPGRVWLGQGDGSLFLNPLQPAIPSARGHDVALGDLDSDGDLDAFISHPSEPERVLFYDQGVFVRSEQTFPGYNQGYRTSLGDLDGDGDLDAFVTHIDFGRQGVDLGDGINRVWLNDGDGTFSENITPELLENDDLQAFEPSYSYDVALADVDGDGDLDALTANNGQPNRVWLNDGTGHFRDSGQNLRTNDRHASWGVKMGDLDGDGDLDAVVCNLDAPDQVWLNDGGSFTAGESLEGATCIDIALGDLDGDGDLDVVSSDYIEDNPAVVFINDGNASFSQSAQSLPARRSMGIALGDIEGDGDLDIVFAHTRGCAGPCQYWSDEIWLNRNSEDPCGFCAEASDQIGTPCGDCGTWQCDGIEGLFCEEPGLCPNCGHMVALEDTGGTTEFCTIVPVEVSTSFWKGCDEELNGSWICSSRELPRHEVSFDYCFQMQRFEVTNAEFFAFLTDRSNGYRGDWCVAGDPCAPGWFGPSSSVPCTGDRDFQNPDNPDNQTGRIRGIGTGRGDPFRITPGYEDHPVRDVTWWGAHQYCLWLGGRLPTESEWEYAARGPDSSDATNYNVFPWGDSITSEEALYSPGTEAVSSHSPQGDSPFGLADMSGSVAEWVLDDISDDYSNTPRSGDEAHNEDTCNKVLRGGSYISIERGVRSASRGQARRTLGADQGGFRCVLPCDP